ncbi:MAG: DNA/RNA non-specific endonuclease [Chitinophagales bacterium]|nr:DNA/RNA non-specific endonuclease [Chitinophagales bacterium]
MRTLILLLILSFTGLKSCFAQKKYYNNSYKIINKIENKKLNYINHLLDSLTTHTLPSDAELVKHTAFISAYSSKYKQPYWVSHIITKDILFGTNYKDNGFIPEKLTKTSTADSSDFIYSGYDRGHMAPAADFRWNKEAVAESYFYSNIAPQNPEFNRGTWAKLEMFIRSLAIQSNELFVVTGPVLNNKLGLLQQGSYMVATPKYFYKILYDLYPPNFKAIAFLMPNKNIPFEIDKYVVSIDSIEQLTGIDFLPSLDDALENQLEQEHDIFDWDKDYKSITDEILDENFGKGKINTIQAIDYIGKDACVCGKAVSVKTVENGKSNPTYINLDKSYPNQLFTVVIYGKNKGNFSYDFNTLKDKTICVSGKVGQYKGTPQIIANSEKQIEVKE